MLCQQCGKNAADVYFMQNINGESTEIMLCGECAAKKGIEVQISFSNFLQGFINAPQSPIHQKEETGIKCPRCNMTANEIIKLGKAGCSQCYNVFSEQFESIVKNVQARGVHVGKYPKGAKNISAEREINTLKLRLAEVVEKEEYEKAAQIRDKIRQLKGGDGNR